MSKPLTPSDREDFQKKHKIDAKDEFIVSFHNDGYGYKESNDKILSDTFNKHGKPAAQVRKITRTAYVVKDINWDIINDLRANDRVETCGPNGRTSPRF